MSEQPAEQGGQGGASAEIGQGVGQVREVAPGVLFVPARSDTQAAEIVRLAGSEQLLCRARELRESGALALACHLVDWLRRAEPENVDAWRLWKELFEERAAGEQNMMARNTFRMAAHEAEATLVHLEQRGPHIGT
jgi:alkyl sulfatase BDS1-like metallo-beta-lactamase superfamily hydrolase